MNIQKLWFVFFNYNFTSFRVLKKILLMGNIDHKQSCIFISLSPKITYFKNLISVFEFKVKLHCKQMYKHDILTNLSFEIRTFVNYKCRFVNLNKLLNSATNLSNCSIIGKKIFTKNYHKI